MEDSRVQELRKLRLGLLGLHKTLLVSERAVYQEARGQAIGDRELLDLLFGDEWFAWLRLISRLVVEFDEVLDSADPAAGAGWLRERTRDLLKGAAGDAQFGPRYAEALQRDPDVVMAHAAVVRGLVL